MVKHVCVCVCTRAHTHTCLVGCRWIKSQLLEFPELTGHPEHISNQHVISLCCNGLINCLTTWMQGVCIFLWQLVGIQQYFLNEWRYHEVYYKMTTYWKKEQWRRKRNKKHQTWKIKLRTVTMYGEGNGNPLQYSCLENPVDRGA